MKNYKDVPVVQKELISITCDCCKKEYEDVMETQEFLHYENDAGYGSIFGDGDQLRLDLCQHCTKELLGKYIRTVGNYIRRAYYAHEVPKELVELIANTKMDPKHDYLNDLLDETDD